MGRDWTPRLSADGRFYCSPACGGGKFCRRTWYEAAERNGRMLAKRLGPDWDFDLSENLGWHYEARLGNIRVTPNENRAASFRARAGYPVPSYTVFVEPNADMGSHAGQFIATAATPEAALSIAAGQARAFAAAIERCLARLTVDGPLLAAPRKSGLLAAPLRALARANHPHG